MFALEVVEHTIRLFDSDAKLGRAKPLPSKDAALKGEMRRHVLAALRAADQPLTSLEIARQVLEIRKISEGGVTVTVFRKRLVDCLFKLKVAGLVVEVPQADDHKCWQLAT